MEVWIYCIYRSQVKQYNKLKEWIMFMDYSVMGVSLSVSLGVSVEISHKKQARLRS
jgi:hypothetical protein